MVRSHIVSVVLSSVALIPNLFSYVSEGGLAGVVENILASQRRRSLMTAGATSEVFLALACVGVDGDVCNVSFMGVRIPDTFLADRSPPYLGILCRKDQIDGQGFVSTVA